MSGLPFKTFSVYFKSAVMLQARDGLNHIQRSNFSDYKPDTRDKILRDLKAASVAFVEKRVKDYREVLKNLAKGMGGGR